MSVRVEAETHAEDPADLVARRDAVQFVRDAVDTLAPHQARAVRLHLAEESNLATAAALGLEPNAANQLLHRARVALRSHLAHLEGTIAVLPGVRQIHAITTRAQAGLAGMPLGELPALAAVVVLGGAAVSSGAGASVTSAQPPRDVVAVVAVVPSTAPPVTVGAPVVVTSPSEPPAAPLQPESVPTTATTTPTPPPSIDFIVTWYPGPEGSAYVDERIECMPIRIDLRPIANIGLDPAALLEPGDDPPFNPDADC